MLLRPYQQTLVDRIHAAWNAGHQNVAVQLPTGAGKTVIFSEILRTHIGTSVAIAHRTELVSQISLALAASGVYHNIIATAQTIRDIVTLHTRIYSKSYYRASARCHVAAVDTLLRRSDIPRDVTLVVQDEAHHVLRDNKWGRAAALFPAARGLYPTATPLRADGRGLGRHADGIIDHMIVGVSMRELIDAGYLTPYRIWAPPHSIDLSQARVAADGDYTRESVRTAIRNAKITGDVVQHYLRLGRGKLGLTFAVDIEHAIELAREYHAAGVPTEVITGQTPALERAQIMQQFRDRKLLQLVNVDVLGEGVDVPAIECVSMCRPTLSFALYSQQFGRALRPLQGKQYAIIIDHVDNVKCHGLPDAPRVWTLDRADRKARGAQQVQLIRTCLGCTANYEIYSRTCPFCGLYTPPAERKTPAQVAGDLTELDADTLAALRGERTRIDAAPLIPRGASDIVAASIYKQHRERQVAQVKLRAAIAAWAGVWHARGVSDREIYIRFYATFGIDIMTAQTLNKKDAEELLTRVTT